MPQPAGTLASGISEIREAAILAYMKALVQRVTSASVTVEGREVAQIGAGLLLFLGIVKGDTDGDLEYVVRKSVGLRVFPDRTGKMNLSVSDTGGEILVVSQFTLAASMRKGYRPSFDNAEIPAAAESMYERLVKRLREEGIRVQTGLFGGNMSVVLVNDGPVTILLDSRESLHG